MEGHELKQAGPVAPLHINPEKQPGARQRCLPSHAHHCSGLLQPLPCPALALTIHVVVLKHGGGKHRIELHLAHGREACMSVPAAGAQGCTAAAATGGLRHLGAECTTPAGHCRTTPLPHLGAAQAELLVLHTRRLVGHAGDLGPPPSHLDPHAAGKWSGAHPWQVRLGRWTRDRSDHQGGCHTGVLLRRRQSHSPPAHLYNLPQLQLEHSPQPLATSRTCCLRGRAAAAPRRLCPAHWCWCHRH